MLFLLFLCLCWFSSVYLLLSVYVYCLTLMRLPCPCFWINSFGHFSWLAFLLHHLLHYWDHRTSCLHPLSLPWAILEFTCVNLSILLFWPVICPYFTAILFQFVFTLSPSVQSYLMPFCACFSLVILALLTSQPVCIDSEWPSSKSWKN